MSDIVPFPANLSLELLAEGAANVVYRIVIPDPDPSTSADHPTNNGGNTPPPSYISPPSSPSRNGSSHAPFRGHLLRLHKAVSWITSYEALHSEQQALIAPHFAPSQLVHQQLTRLPAGLLARLNADLRAAEASGRRPSKRHGLYLDEAEAHGLLVQDMTADPVRGQMTLELKPKWLVQSPTAPKDSKRCRTCALRAQRASEGKPEPSNAFCPLFLTSKDTGALIKAVRALLVSEPPEVIHRASLDTRLRDFFAGNALIATLASLQTRLDPSGVLSLPEEAEYDASLVPPEFLVATTIRDCTLFIRLDAAGAAPIDARLGDLDLKAPDSGKLSYWKSNEEVLITGGWYQARDRRKVGCLLET